MSHPIDKKGKENLARNKTDPVWSFRTFRELYGTYRITLALPVKSSPWLSSNQPLTGTAITDLLCHGWGWCSQALLITQVHAPKSPRLHEYSCCSVSTFIALFLSIQTEGAILYVGSLDSQLDSKPKIRTWRKRVNLSWNRSSYLHQYRKPLPGIRTLDLSSQGHYL